MPLTPLRLRHPRRLAAQAVDRARVFDTLVNNLEGMAYRCLIDPQWTMVFVSQGCMALTGYAPSELSGDGVVSWEQITHPHDRMRVRAVVQAAGDSGQRFHVEYRITTRGGELRRVIERGVGVSDEQGERVIEGFIEDITVRHATLEALEHAEQGTDRMHRTLEQLLMLARVEGSLSFEDGVQCSAEQVAKLAMQDAAGGERQRIKLQLPKQLSSAPVQMPAVLSIAALRNLLDNALRHTPADAEVELSLETVGQRARFVVRDHGPGIAAEDLQHLTQRFWRNGQSTGCGLGLAIVQAIVQRCDCALHFDSRPDGLRVELTMPLQPV